MISARGNLAAVSPSLSFALAGYRTHLAYINKDDGRKGWMQSQRLKGRRGTTQLKVPPLIMPSESEGSGKGGREMEIKSWFCGDLKSRRVLLFVLYILPG